MEAIILPQKSEHSLTKEQKKAVGLLSIGTFLEYFDLMLYVHMAVLLNELFFPKTDPLTTSLITAFSFCSTYLLRPLGALIFGYIGDNIGRRETVIITTSIMAVACFIITVLPTYEEIGIKASVGITICRLLQGMSSMGEMVGAEIYLTETIKPPARYFSVGLLSVFCILGGTFALGVANVVLFFKVNWRIAFAFGMVIAIIGISARKSLRETPDFADAKRRVRNIINQIENIDKGQEKEILNDNVNAKTLVSLFLIQCLSPLCFYFAYIYSADTLKNSFNYTAEQVINHNFLLSIGQLISFTVLTYLSYKIHPLKIVRVLLFIFVPLVFLSPFLLSHVNTPFDLLLLQSFILLFSFSSVPAYPIFLTHFPIFKRFSYTAMSYAISRIFIYVITYFGLIFLVKYFGHYGITTVFICATIGFIYGIRHFQTLEKATGNFC